jgi:RimJ/RimL family protein N-acetyltransferase
MDKILTTARLKLALLQLTDSIFIKSLLNTDGWIQNIGNKHINNLDDAEAYIDKILTSENYDYYVVRLKDSNTSIGIISFIKRENQNFPDIGFAFLPEYNGKGYAYEAAKAFLESKLKEKLWQNIIAITIPSNRNSIALLEKLGLKHQKTFEDNGEVLSLYSLSAIQDQ